MFLLYGFTIFISCISLIRAEPIELTNQTWKVMLKGEWMVEFFAPWCPACQNFKSTWNDFSKAMASKNVKVAAINIEDNPSLSPRFRITALPTIFYVRDGTFRQYSGDRSLSALKTYLEKEQWKETEPVSAFFAPDSFLISAMSAIFDGTLSLKNIYNMLHDEYAWPAWAIYISFAIAIGTIGISIGFATISTIDYAIAIATKLFGKKPKKDKIDSDENESEPIATDQIDRTNNTSDTHDQTVRQRRRSNE